MGFADLVNPKPIFSNHIKSLKENANWLIIFIWFILFPSIGSIVLTCLQSLSKNIINNIITIMSIFIGFLVNILVLLVTTEKERVGLIKELSEYLYSDISYELVLGLIILVLGLIFRIVLPHIQVLLTQLLTFLVYFLFLNFILTLFQIIRRLYVLYRKEV